MQVPWLSLTAVRRGDSASCTGSLKTESKGCGYVTNISRFLQKADEPSLLPQAALSSLCHSKNKINTWFQKCRLIPNRLNLFFSLAPRCWQKCHSIERPEWMPGMQATECTIQKRMFCHSSYLSSEQGYNQQMQLTPAASSTFLRNTVWWQNKAKHTFTIFEKMEWFHIKSFSLHIRMWLAWPCYPVQWLHKLWHNAWWKIKPLHITLETREPEFGWLMAGLADSRGVWEVQSLLGAKVRWGGAALYGNP